MKRFLILALTATLMIFFCAPAALGIVDAWCYLMLGAQVSSVEWNSTTVPIAWVMALLGVFCLLIPVNTAERG